MQTRNRRSRGIVAWFIAYIALVVALVGCGGGSTTQLPFTSPPAPMPGQAPTQPFFIDTLNYFNLYTSSTAPFDFNSQFSTADYPVPVNYQTDTPGPAGFDAKTETEAMIRLWNQADPRVTIVSGVPSGERIKVDLVDSISYSGINNILGLTEMLSGGNNPYFRVRVAVNDPITHQPLDATELDKTLAHELGHAFGLGHAPDQRDLMYYRANALQGLIPKYFVTYGDAITIWTTLNFRHVNYVQRDPVTQAMQNFTAQNTRSTTPQGPWTVVCVYTKE